MQVQRRIVMTQWNNSLYGNYRQKKFTDLYGVVNDFITDYKNLNPDFVNGIPVTISDDSISTLFYLLYARYGNSTIASSDETQFKYKLFSTIFMYGPTWEKRLEVQNALRGMDLDELRESSKAIYNHAFNPATAPKMDDSGEHIMDYINDQNVTLHKRSKTDAYALLIGLLETDVTNEFLDKFKKLFLTIVEPELPLWYITDLEGEE